MDDDYYDFYDDDGDEENLPDMFDHKRDAESSAEEDPEHFHCVAVSEEEVFQITNAAVANVSQHTGLSLDDAKSLLICNKWDSDGILKIFIPTSPDPDETHFTSSGEANFPRECAVCLETFPSALMVANAQCGHEFCRDCWNYYLGAQVEEGKGYDIQCMETKCAAILGEEFVIGLLSNSAMKEKFRLRFFRDCIESHMNFALCATHGCGRVFFAEHPDNKRVSCDKCKAEFCFACGSDYHLPCDCRTIRHWWRKIAEDANTASYMAAHTKDCPSCERSIEKNGGCNHMVCRICKHEFCWICMGDWKQHGKSYYECNRYKAAKEGTADPAAGSGEPPLPVPKESEARIALNKYLFYFTRWKGHEESLALEQKLFTQIQERVQTKIQHQQGTLIDWQYLTDAGKLLLKCRHALQYTYAFAYYVEDGPKRMLFEHLQADLESTIENLSFSIERAETVDVAGLQAQMRSAEFRRKALFKDAKMLALPAPS
ncbi:E3 ubiquitin-protein ligase ARIH2 [Hypsibius exemplaris]|uniref:RBR-type E3 ubiquitin transferase n=1 Tax=Hypsibius exemplaris TaxID=2072580 RepID=A0A9X6RK82_HYPEX|nr:E3 ubiquitin-protein ligase ARIH2 [Hypsibius exemplaris]